MPFADPSGVIACRVQIFLNHRLRSIDSVENRHSVFVAVLSRQNRRATWRANRVHCKTIREPHSLFGDAVQVRCLINPAAVATERVRRVIIRHDKNYVWPNLADFRSSRAERDGPRIESRKDSPHACRTCFPAVALFLQWDTARPPM